MSEKQNATDPIKFLKKVYPDGPWCLTAIDPDKNAPIATATFNPQSEGECRAWIDERNGSRNLYWHVNPVTRPLSKKAEREDIKEVCFLHVDVDPGAGDLVKEQEDILLMFLPVENAGKLPPDIPKPTALIFSGGGYQAFWKLATPLPINGDLARAEDAKLYNIAMEDRFGGDNCHDISRIMRLPGTWNIPDAKKLKKGRTRAMAELIEWRPECVYAIESFKKAPPEGVTLGMDSGADKLSPVGGPTVVIDPAKARRLTSLDELNEWNVPDRVKVIIVQGSHPDPEEIQKKRQKAKGKQPSRSEWLFDVCCNLVRCGVPDELIYGLITDKTWAISESVVELKSGAHRYAVRQIAKAHEFTADPDLAWFNSRFCVLEHEGKKPLVLSWQPSELTPDVLVPHFSTLEGFQQRYEHKLKAVGADAQGNPKLMQLGKWWRFHDKRRQYPGIRFEPGAPEITTAGYLNLWRGFSIQPAAGNVDRILDHIHQRLANGNLAHAAYILRWLAWAVQNPDKVAEVALVLKGGRGVGKGLLLGNIMLAVFGPHGVHITHGGSFTGRFNAQYMQACYVFADEIIVKGDKAANSTLKTMITERSLQVEQKGVDIKFVPNRLKIAMATNEEWAIPTGIDERRFAIMKCRPSPATQEERDEERETYFRPLVDMLNGGGREAFFQFLLQLDLCGWHPRDEVPQTVELSVQKGLNLTGLEKVVFGFLSTGEMPEWIVDGPTKRHVGNSLLRDYARKELGYHISEDAPNRLLGSRLGFETDKNPSRGHRFPDLKEARAIWDAKMFPGIWLNDGDEWTLVEDRRPKLTVLQVVEAKLNEVEDTPF